MSSDRPASADARSIVSTHERSLDAAMRRRQGVHYTPSAVAEPVIELALDALGGLPRIACDPSCGGGAFLLSLADRLFAAGVSPGEVVRHRLVGVELDPAAAAIARAALSRWAFDHGEEVAFDDVRVHQGDAMMLEPGRWPDRPPGGFDLVLGNPPFLSQLDRRTARDASRREAADRRFGPLGAYTDEAGLFLLVACELVAGSGVVAMVQPQSLLSARDAAPVRARVLDVATLRALWAHAGRPFPDADVHVCAPILRRDRFDGTSQIASTTVVWSDGQSDHRSEVPSPQGDQRWGALLGPALGVPDTPRLTGTAVGEVATATAGFRDEFYALRDAMFDGDRPASIHASSPPSAASSSGGTSVQPQLPGMHPDTDPQLVTVGMIDPLRSRWGDALFRVGGTRVTSPRVRLEQLDAASPGVARWARARLRPKVLVATQTRIVEAVADPRGRCIPMTPTISVEPIDDRIDVWRLVAALGAPPVAAAAVRDHLGSGRSTAAIRWSARGVSKVPLPTHMGSWERGAALARELSEGAGRCSGTARRLELLGAFGAVMTEAYGMDRDDPVLAWWSMRLPRR